MAKGNQNTVPQCDRIKIFTEAEIDRMFENALRILEETGYQFHYQPALKVLESAGALVDYHTTVAKIPRDMVYEALRLIPKGWWWKGFSEEYDVWVSPSNLQLHAHATVNVIDRKTKQLRPTVLKDVGEYHCFVNELDNYVGHQPFGGVRDAPPELSGAHIIAEQVKHAKKPFVSLGPSGVNEDADIQLEVGDAAGRVLTGLTGSVSPLTLPENMCYQVMAWAKRGWPIATWDGPIPGATGPMTLAGTLTLALAESFAQFVLIQVVGPGTPVNPSFENFFLDMSHGGAYPGLEGVMLHIGFAQFMHRWGIATHSGLPMSLGNIPDYQEGSEKTLQMLMCALGGVNVIGGGEQSLVMNNSYGDLIRSDAVFTQIKRIMRGVEVDDATIALDLIKKVAYSPNTYLTEKHTKKHFKTEVVIPRVYNTLSYDSWLNAGGKDTETRADEICAQMWERIEVKPIVSDDVCRDIDKVLAQAVKIYCK